MLFLCIDAPERSIRLAVSSAIGRYHMIAREIDLEIYVDVAENGDFAQDQTSGSSTVTIP